MTIQEEKSKRFADCIKNLYEKKMYSIEYAILQLEKFRDSNKIIESDYEEYYNYFCSEMDKKNVVVIEDEKTIEQLEEVKNNITEDNVMILDTVENDTVDDTVEGIENQEEVESAE